MLFSRSFPRAVWTETSLQATYRGDYVETASLSLKSSIIHYGCILCSYVAFHLDVGDSPEHDMLRSGHAKALRLSDRDYENR